MMETLLSHKCYDFISEPNKQFIISFNQEMNQLGYGFDDSIGPGYCWGIYMLIYRKLNVKSKKVYARVYIRENDIVLRLYFNNIDKHKQFIENSPKHIFNVFAGDHGKCNHCHNEKENRCKFRKSYFIHNQLIEKCNGITFEFQKPDIQKLSDYIKLFSEFYPSKNKYN